jgi:nicotinamide-nucleotide amidase
MGESPEIELGRRLRETQATLATAESCSGGLIAHRITSVPGSSDYFLGGVITYSNEAKEKFLGVQPDSLQRFGAVSEPVASEMDQGAARQFGSTYAIAVTGIAGPGGGTDEKPVGLVYIGVAGPGGVQVHEHRFSGDRAEVKAQTAEQALQHVLESFE